MMSAFEQQTGSGPFDPPRLALANSFRMKSFEQHTGSPEPLDPEDPAPGGGFVALPSAARPFDMKKAKAIKNQKTRIAASAYNGTIFNLMMHDALDESSAAISVSGEKR